jgi:hypothetical protein
VGEGKVSPPAETQRERKRMMLMRTMSCHEDHTPIALDRIRLQIKVSRDVKQLGQSDVQIMFNG